MRAQISPKGGMAQYKLYNYRIRFFRNLVETMGLENLV